MNIFFFRNYIFYFLLFWSDVDFFAVYKYVIIFFMRARSQKFSFKYFFNLIFAVLLNKYRKRVDLTQFECPINIGNFGKTVILHLYFHFRFTHLKYTWFFIIRWIVTWWKIVKICRWKIKDAAFLCPGDIWCKNDISQVPRCSDRPTIFF